MKKRLSLANLISRLQTLNSTMEGVYSFGDLCNLIGAGSDIGNAKVIARLQREGVVQRIKRGIYVTRDPNLWVLGFRIKTDAYVSMDSVLAKNGLVGSLPARAVSMVYPGRKTTIETPSGDSLRFFSIQPDLYFGFFPQKNGVEVADKEKAYLDLIYFYTKGARYIFDPLVEVKTNKLDTKKLMTYLKRYKNPKFVTFVKGLLRAND